MKTVKFTKVHGAGNDFVLIDRKLNKDLLLTTDAIKKICRQHFGVGADGVLIISESDKADFIVEYFEADGTTGNLCANGSRCVIKYAKETNRMKGNSANFIFNNIEYSGEILSDGQIKFKLNSIISSKFNFFIKAANQLIKSSYIDNGTPHVVIKITDILKTPKDIKSFYTELKDIPIIELAREIRYSKDFAPKGTNVNFYQINGDYINIRSYERGVENETLACGTGIAAAAVACYMNEKMKPPLKFVSFGGDVLTVDFSVENQSIKQLSLIGRAELVYNGELSI